MFDESKHYNQVNKLAAIEGSQAEVKMIEGEAKTVPAITLGEHEARPNIFFREDLETSQIRAAELTEELAKVEDKVGGTKQILKHNTRLPSEYQLKQSELEERTGGVTKNKFDFKVPLTKEEIERAEEERQKAYRIDLSILLG